MSEVKKLLATLMIVTGIATMGYPMVRGKGTTDLDSSFVITKTADAVNFSSVGTVVNYTVKVVNNGPVALTKAVVKDALIKLSETIPKCPVVVTQPANVSLMAINNLPTNRVRHCCTGLTSSRAVC